jgi:chemotaxis protein CheZ
MAINPQSLAALRPELAALTRAFEAGDVCDFVARLYALTDGCGVASSAAPAAPSAAVGPQLRRLTCDAQAALERFRDEARLDALAEYEVPDARQRLDHVVKLTDEAAHRTLDLVERSGPLADHAARESAALSVLWRELTERDQNLFDSREIIDRVQRFLDRTRSDADSLRSNLSEVLLAQGYQDITGQIIRSVTRLVTELETVLGQLVLIADGMSSESYVRGDAVDTTRDSSRLSAELRRGAGRVIPGVSDRNSVTAQDDIDALLSGVASSSQ